MNRRAPLVALLCLPAVLLACGGDDDESLSTAPATVPNVGNLPGPLAVHATTTTEVAAPTTDSPATTSDSDESDDSDDSDDEEPEAQTVGELADGPRVLLLGDSVTQSIGQEFSGGACALLVPAGWQVAMDAQTGRFIDHGAEVLEERVDDADWDAVALNFGSNYRGDAEEFGRTLRQMLNRLLPRPVLLITVSEPEENRAEVNYVLREAARRYENVRVLEWSEATRVDDSLTGGDGLHLTADGQDALATMLAEAMGQAPGGGEGACLELDELDVGDTSDDEPSDTASPDTASPDSESQDDGSPGDTGGDSNESSDTTDPTETSGTGDG